jgi:hypothetical protein
MIYRTYGERHRSGITTSPVAGAKISRCYNTGAIKGAYNTGGIVGRGETSVHVTDCYNLGSVTGDGGSQLRSRRSSALRPTWTGTAS